MIFLIGAKLYGETQKGGLTHQKMVSKCYFMSHVWPNWGKKWLCMHIQKLWVALRSKFDSFLVHYSHKNMPAPPKHTHRHAQLPSLEHYFVLTSIDSVKPIGLWKVVVIPETVLIRYQAKGHTITHTKTNTHTAFKKCCVLLKKYVWGQNFVLIV